MPFHPSRRSLIAGAAGLGLARTAGAETSDWPNQTIRLVHESISRAAFGQGAIFAAKWLVDKGPGLYTMEQIVSDLMGRNIPIY